MKKNELPRKVIIGTIIKSFWEEYPGIEKRLSQLSQIIDEINLTSLKIYNRNVDIIVLPEAAVTGGRKGRALERSLPFKGKIQLTFSFLAKKYQCYITVPMELIEDEERKICYNACILIDRNGMTMGIYRKLHPAIIFGSEDMEGGITPGKEVPVFECDFGKVGIQICFDMEFDYGWKEMAKKGVELVLWPTQSPQTSHPVFRAMQYRIYIVSSTWRNNASIFEPTGKITAQIKEPEKILVKEIDLSYVILPWAPQLKNGEALREKFGDKIGFRYYEDEDCGIFWSNDFSLPVSKMVNEIGLGDWSLEKKRLIKFFNKIRTRRY
ncbi:MAG TPA: carbon-nitrogen hydrolase family protein [bacterium]|nr:carbon-nitrogen hydrolase family protein [bacterium]HOM27116.1 carbon-nitrogen hydrolase family protein [bacterium]